MYFLTLYHCCPYRRDSPCPDSGLDSPARVGETGRTEVPHIVVDQSSSDRHLSVESTSCVLETVESVQTIEVESLDVVREQPPPVHIVTDTTPTKPDTTPTKPDTTPTKPDNIHTHPTATKDFILSRGSRDFGISLVLSPVSFSSHCSLDSFLCVVIFLIFLCRELFSVFSWYVLSNIPCIFTLAHVYVLYVHTNILYVCTHVVCVCACVHV